MERKPITVSALNKYLKYRLDNDQNLQNVLLKAEISNFKRHSSGHFYFTLKDEESQIAAVMFFNNAKSVLFDPRDGDKVIVEGFVSVYEAAGKYQVYVTKMNPDGIGDLYLAYERLKAKLEAEGLFDSVRKRPLPAFPKVVGVITSPTGAAVRDIIHIINRRYPLCQVLVYPALVQGEEAKTSLVSMIEKANRDRMAEVLIIGRGGGSIEDLWAFNEEIVARAVYGSTLPVVSAVGHETDFTIIDFVADLRAPTPSGAAEIVVPDRGNLERDVAKLGAKLDFLIQNRLDADSRRLRGILDSSVFRTPERLMEKPSFRLQNLSERLEGTNPRKILGKQKETLGYLMVRMEGSFRSLLDRQTYKFQGMTDKLELLNPLFLMKKGYAVVKKDHQIIRSVNQLTVKDPIDVLMTDGLAECVVAGIRKDA
jgi:exodeoxyribonuclease VII large subunit